MKTKFLLFMAAILLCVAKGTAQVSTWDGTSEVWNKGSGTEEDPYLIESAKHLAYLSDQVKKVTNAVAYSNIYFKLTVDIDLNNRTWLPIGGDLSYNNRTNMYPCFGGIFDGDNHKIG